MTDYPTFRREFAVDASGFLSEETEFSVDKSLAINARLEGVGSAIVSIEGRLDEGTWVTLLEEVTYDGHEVDVAGWEFVRVQASNVITTNGLKVVLYGMSARARQENIVVTKQNTDLNREIVAVSLLEDISADLKTIIKHLKDITGGEPL